MKRKTWIGILGLVAVLVAGGLFASNMGFKLNYTLNGPSGGSSGTTALALPYNQQTNLIDAEDLIDDINAGAGSSVVASVSRYLNATDGLETYTGLTGVNFSLAPGEGYLLKTTADTNYIVVGSHDPALSVSLSGPAGGSSGTTLWSFPYHSTAGNAEDLIGEINTAVGSPVVASVSRYLSATDGLETYTGLTGTNFALAPGEGYYVKVNSSASWVPSHY